MSGMQGLEAKKDTQLGLGTETQHSAGSEGTLKCGCCGRGTELLQETGSFTASASPSLLWITLISAFCHLLYTH